MSLGTRSRNRAVDVTRSRNRAVDVTRSCTTFTIITHTLEDCDVVKQQALFVARVLQVTGNGKQASAMLALPAGYSLVVNSLFDLPFVQI